MLQLRDLNHVQQKVQKPHNKIRQVVRKKSWRDLAKITLDAVAPVSREFHLNLNSRVNGHALGLQMRMSNRIQHSTVTRLGKNKHQGKTTVMRGSITQKNKMLDNGQVMINPRTMRTNVRMVSTEVSTSITRL